MGRPNMYIPYNINNFKYSDFGTNNLSKRFRNAFEALLTFDYNEGTQYGKYFNRITEDMKSEAYISQPEIEFELQNFKDSVVNDAKCLVGFTGIGKTTLIKNFFGIVDRKPFIDNSNNIIAYLSLYSKAINSKEDLIKVIVRFIRSIISCVTGNNTAIDLNWDDFYCYFEENNDELLNNLALVPNKQYSKEDILVDMEKHYPREYYLCMLKYYLHNKKKIKDLIIIVDDLEAIDDRFHLSVIENFFTIRNCLDFNKEKRYLTKLLISMRAYTFRKNLARQATSYRFDEGDIDTIIKDKIPDIEDIINRRFEIINERLDEFKEICNQETWAQAKQQLDIVINGLNLKFGKLIVGLTHNNISRTLKIFFKILTNNRWFTFFRDVENNGVANINYLNYDYNTKESVLKALVYGEGDVYVDYEDNVLPNILHCHEEKKKGVELLGLYILKFYLRTNSVGKNYLYGVDRGGIKGKHACEYICNALNLKENSELSDKVNYMMEYLYKGGLLLHSIFEPESGIDNERIYNENYSLYISVRALSIFSIMESSSILLEFYRDDIDTELANCNRISTELSFTNRLVYIIRYIEILFDIEKKYIKKIVDMDLYIGAFGKEFLVSHLLLGVERSIAVYYNNKKDDYIIVKEQLKELLDKIKVFQTSIESRIIIDNKVIDDFEKF